MQVLSRNGITSIVDARSYWQRGYLDVWQQLLRDEPSKFTVRAILDLWAAPEMEDSEQLDQLKQLYSNDEDSLLRISGIKVCIIEIYWHPWSYRTVQVQC